MAAVAGVRGVAHLARAVVRNLFFPRGRGELHGFCGEAARVRRLAGWPAEYGACQPEGRGMRIRCRVSTPIGELVLLGTTAGLSEIRVPHAAAGSYTDFAGKLREFDGWRVGRRDTALASRGGEG